MSRTTLCVLTAALLAILSLGLMAGRHALLGDQVEVPGGPGSWKITLLIQGKGTDRSRLTTLVPLDFGRQHLWRETYHSDELLPKPMDGRHPGRSQVVWTPRVNSADGSFRARCEFYCSVNVSRPTAPMTELARQLSAPPGPGEHLRSERGIGVDEAELAELARRLTAGIDRPQDQAEALFQFVAQEIGNEPTLAGPPMSASECFHYQSGDCGGKSRLLAALLRNRGIPARLVTGLVLTRGHEQSAHVWVEAWLRNQWLPMCPFFHHFGRVPRTYLVFAHGDEPIVRARDVRHCHYGFLVEHLADAAQAGNQPATWSRQFFAVLSFHALPPAERRLVEFLLLLPLAALIVCVYRNVVGLQSFGTFAPALLGLAFRDLGSLPGIGIFVALILVGWGFRRLLDRYHLLQVPRSAVLLSLVVAVLLVAIVAASYYNLPPTRYISLFPLIILTGMIERFWTLEAEDGTASSFRTLLSTVVMAASVSLVLGWSAVPRVLYRYPESLGLIMAGQLLLGRYTGYRLLELYRFRDFLRPSAEVAVARPVGHEVRRAA
ncbi:MAG: lasso peptide biosynthesis protein [Gemmataceae bacterium]|nr:lasso peptide biosynthesis protein [Gemmataceae bacterium]MDW8265048.1 7TM domain-containing protein [Gemmataceae bacterium]